MRPADSAISFNCSISALNSRINRCCSSISATTPDTAMPHRPYNILYNFGSNNKFSSDYGRSPAPSTLINYHLAMEASIGNSYLLNSQDSRPS